MLQQLLLTSVYHTLSPTLLCCSQSFSIQFHCTFATAALNLSIGCWNTALHKVVVFPGKSTKPAGGNAGADFHQRHVECFLLESCEAPGKYKARSSQDIGTLFSTPNKRRVSGQEKTSPCQTRLHHQSNAGHAGLPWCFTDKCIVS
jgi:hypothetical protein